MRNYFLRMFFCVCLVLGFTSPVFAAQVAYEIDSQHSFVQWRVNHFGFSDQTGKWMVADGILLFDQAKPENSKVNVTVHIADVATGLIELDYHLKNQAFFEVTKYPVATFVSDKVTMTGKDTAKVSGMLTMHGVTKPLVLNVKLNRIGVNPISVRETIGVTATAALKRSDFGIVTLLPGLGDDVKLEIEVEAGRVMA